MNNHCLMAMALRAGGRLEDAPAQLRDAQDGLETKKRNRGSLNDLY